MARPLGQPGEHSRQIRVRVTPDDQERVYREASLLGVSATEVLRRALRGYFAQPEKKRRRSA